MVAVKRCSKCKELKPQDQFTPNDRYTTKLSSYCKKCSYEAVKDFLDKKKIENPVNKIHKYIIKYRSENEDLLNQLFTDTTLLTPKEQSIIEMRLGLNQDKIYKFDDIADYYELPKFRVVYIYNNAIKRFENYKKSL